MGRINTTNVKRRRESDYEHDEAGALKRQKCYKCDSMLDISQFTVDNLRKSGFTSICRACTAITTAAYRLTPERFVSSMVKTGENVDKNKKRDMTYGTDITYRWFMQQFEKGCHWSGLPMQMKPFCWDKASIDRIDDSKRHCQENCRLTIIALNVTRKWDDALMATCMDAYLYPPEPLTEQEASDILAVKIVSQKQSVSRKPNNEQGEVFCTWCDSFQNAECFTKDVHAGCKPCRTAYKSERRERDMTTVLRNMLHNTMGAGKKQPFKSGDLSLEDLKEIYVEQRGLCAVSGIRLTLTGHFKVSPERVVSRGRYTKANVVLVCQCLNVQDNTVLNKDTEAESQGLTKERWSLIMDSMIEKKRAEWRSNILGV